MPQYTYNNDGSIEWVDDEPNDLIDSGDLVEPDPNDLAAFDPNDLPAVEPIGEGIEAIDGIYYTKNPDGSWDGSDGSTFTDSDYQIYKDSLTAIGDGETPGQGGVVGGVNIPPGLTGPGTRPAAGESATDWLKKLGVTNKDGDLDWAKILGLGAGALGLVDAAISKPQNAATMAELRAGMSKTNEPAPWTAEQMAFGTRPMQTGSALERIYAADMKSPEVPGKTYAEGGEVEMEGALSQAFAGAVMGSEGGQSDLVEARLSPGEYVLDAETVSALGDGNTAAGIAKLDELRQQLRAQKRSAPTDEIPPQAQGPLSYLQGA